MRISALAATLTAVPFLTLPAASLTHPGAAAQAQRQDHQYRESFTTTVIGAPEADTLLIRRNLREVRVRISGLPATIDRARAREILERRVVGQLVTVNVISGDAAAGTELAADVTTGEGRNLGQELLTWMAEPIRPAVPPRAGGDGPTAVDPAPRAAGTVRDPDESGLRHPWRFSVGAYEISSRNAFRQALIDASGADTSGVAVKLDYSFFRPTRHEAMVSYSHVFAPSGAGDDGDALQIEYRWRFGNQGRGYYGLNAGALFVSGDAYDVYGSALGFEFGKRTFIELRGVYEPESEDSLSSLVLGVRF